MSSPQINSLLSILDAPTLRRVKDRTQDSDLHSLIDSELAALTTNGLESPNGTHDWPAVGPLPEATPLAPQLPPEMLPATVRDWIVDVAERGAVALETIAVPALIALGVVIGRSVGIRPSRSDDYLVVPNMWGGDIDRPGAMKTWRSDQGFAPLRHLASWARLEFEGQEATAAAEIERIQVELDAIRSEMKKAAKKGDSDRVLGLQEDLKDKQAELKDADVTERRYLTHDATVEKLGELLRDNPRGMLVLRDELAGFLRTLDKSGREGDREFYLESWSGTGSFTSDRIARGTVHIPAVCVSIYGGIQPGKLRRYLDDAMGSGSGADGLLQRFQLLIWPETVPWERVDRSPDEQAFNRVLRIFQKLDSLDPSDVGAVEPEGGVPFLRFDDDAQMFFDEWRDRLEHRLRSRQMAGTPAFEAHIAKYRSLMPSLALIFHLVENVERTYKTLETSSGGGSVGFDGRRVGLSSAMLAANWCDFLEAHAVKIYSAELNQDILSGLELARHIEAGDVLDGMSVRDIYLKGWSRLTTSEAAEAAAAAIEGAGWCRIEDRGPGPKGGRPSRILRIHPSLNGGISW